MAKNFGNRNKRRGSVPPTMKMRSNSHKERLKRQTQAQRKLSRDKYFKARSAY